MVKKIMPNNTEWCKGGEQYQPIPNSFETEDNPSDYAEIHVIKGVRYLYTYYDMGFIGGIYQLDGGMILK